MKKLLILIVILACMGCGDVCIPVTGGEGCGNSIQKCGWGQEWDACTCECEWVF